MTLLEFFEGSAVNVLPQGSASNVGMRRLEVGPLEKLVKELPRVPELDLASKEEHVGGTCRCTGEAGCFEFRGFPTKGRYLILGKSLYPGCYAQTAKRNHCPN